MRYSITYLGLVISLTGIASTAQAVEEADLLPSGDTPVQEIIPEVAAALEAGTLGDVNSDGVVTIVDALMIAQHYVGMAPAGFDPTYADVNLDGDVSIVDALIIAQWYVGMEQCDGLDNDGDGEIDEGCPEYSFFVFADVQIDDADADNEKDTATLARAIEKMRRVDDNAMAAFSVGDLTFRGSQDEWRTHNTHLGSMFNLNATKVGRVNGMPAYFAALGNHDGPTAYPYGSGENWAQKWSGQYWEAAAWGEQSNEYWAGGWTLGLLPLAESEESRDPGDGVYYSFIHENATFAVLDSEQPDGTVYADQTETLARALDASKKPFTFLFFHKPVYACLDRHAGILGQGLRWHQMAEEHDAIVFNGHTHVYTRSVPLRSGMPSGNDSGVTQIEVGTLSNANPGAETIASGELSVTGQVLGPSGVLESRTDEYRCTTTDEGGHLANSGRENDHTFCHVQVKSCRAALNCYSVDTDDVPTTPEVEDLIDTWEIDRCPAQ